MREPTRSSSSFIDRENELHQLHHMLNSVLSAGRPKIVLIQGDFGVGKTALAEHFLTEISQQNSSLLIGRGICAKETQLNGLIPFSQVLASIAERSIERGIIVGNLAEFVKRVAPAWLDIFTAGTASKLAKTIEEGTKLLRSNTYSQDTVFVQFSRALRQLAQKHPVVSLIEDLHWADASSLGLVFHLARNFQDAPVLFIYTYRPVEAMETGENALLFRDIRANLIRYGASELELRQGISVAEYVAQRYPLNMFSADFIAYVQGITGGHALFVDQLFSLSEETSAITSTPTPDGRPVWKLSPGEWKFPEIPGTLMLVLDERFRLMKDELRDILVTASVEGEDFTAQVVSRLRRLDEYEVREKLETLEARYRLIQERGSKEVDERILDFYRFVHRFFREHIHNHLNAARRRELHRQVGECLEALYRDRSEIAGQLYVHFIEANESKKATRYALMAAQFEESRFAWLELEKWCENGLKLVEKLPRDHESIGMRLDLLEQSAYGNYASGRYSKAIERYRTALQFARQEDVEPKRIAMVCEKLADMLEYENKNEEAIQLIDQGMQILIDNAIPESETHFELQALLGFMQMRQGKNDLAVQTLREAFALAEKLPHSLTLERAIARAFYWLGISLGHLAQYTEAADAYQKSISLANGIGDNVIAITSMLNLADDNADRGELQESQVLVSKALDIAQQIGNLDIEAYARSIKGSILMSRGMPKEAAEQLTEAITLCIQIGSHWNVPIMRADLALAYLALRSLDMAHEQAKQSLIESDENQDQFAVGYAHFVLGKVETSQEDWNSGIMHFNRAIEIFQSEEDDLFLAKAQRGLGELFHRKGNRQQGLELLRTALLNFQELELTREVAEIQQLLDAS